MTVEVEAESEGEATVPAKRLSELVRHFDCAEIAISVTENTATIAAGKSRYRLPVIPLADMPSPLALECETGQTAVLRRSERLFELAAGSFRLVSKLIDATFPDYARIIPSTSEAIATVDRKAPVEAIARFDAVSNPQARASWLTLSWTDDGEMLLSAADGSEDRPGLFDFTDALSLRWC